jgi:predicted O-methyltransferase YrrM
MSRRHAVAGMTEAPELLSMVRSARRRLAELGPPRARSEEDFQRVALPDPDADVLRDLLVAEGVRVVVEIGLAYGSSALAIGEALLTVGKPNPNHVIIDAYQDRFDDVGTELVESAGLSGVATFVIERSQLALPRLIAEQFVADAAFVDGSHIFHNVFVDLCFLREIVRPGGLILLDDCGWPSVATAVRYFELNTAWTPQPIGPPTRLRAFRLPSVQSEPRFEEFQPFNL